MAERLPVMPPAGRRISQYARYADGHVWKLRIGEDVRFSTHNSARRAAQFHAQCIGMTVLYRQLSKTELAVQFLPKGAQ
jgi:hypothetical protein